MRQRPDGAVTSADELREEIDRLRLLHSIGLEFNSSLDFDALLPHVFHGVLTALGAEGGSLWIAEDEMLRCRLAVGGASQRLVGAEMPVGTGFVGDVARRQKTTIVTRATEDPRYQPGVDESGEMVATTVMATAMVARGETVGAIQVANKLTGDGVFDARDRELLEGLAASAAVALRNAQLHAAEKRAHDLALLLEISREITSTLDLDRLLRSVVNLALRALPFDRGAIGLMERGRCEIRSVTGQEIVDRKDPKIQDLATRAAWAAGRGETFYLGDRDAPATDAERTFVAVFGSDLEADGVRSGLYLPLADEEGTVGILLFEAARPEFASEAQREVAGILANQTAVALRNAELYNQVPMADALGAFAARKRALLRTPRRRLQLYTAVAVALVAAFTLVRWPLRVSGEQPTFRPTSFAEVRALAPGVVERVFVTEGSAVAQGAPLVQLRDASLEAERIAIAAEVTSAERSAAVAAARRDAADERLHRIRAEALRRELALVDEQVARTTVRAPVAGVVLTPRPGERIGASLSAGDAVLTLGRTDTLELEFGVRQRDIERVRAGEEVRLRVDALPQRTFRGRVVLLGQLPLAGAGAADGEAWYPVRAVVANPDGALKPGMTAYARVLTSPVSAASRLVRGPARWARLAWWRIWS